MKKLAADLRGLNTDQNQRSAGSAPLPLGEARVKASRHHNPTPQSPPRQREGESKYQVHTDPRLESRGYCQTSLRDVIGLLTILTDLLRQLLCALQRPPELRTLDRCGA